MGRPKSERPTNTNVAQRVLAQAKAESLWLKLIEMERKRLGLDAGETAKNVSIMPLVNLLKYLECRAYGNPTDTVNHLHDKPIDLNVTFSLAERIQKARQRAKQI